MNLVADHEKEKTIALVIEPDSYTLAFSLRLQPSYKLIYSVVHTSILQYMIFPLGRERCLL